MTNLKATRQWIFATGLVIACVGLIGYWNTLAIGFWTDDYEFLETAGRLDLAEYLRVYFDPRVQWHWYRPMQGLAWGVGYALFGVEPMGYHLFQLVWHIGNTLQLFALTARITRRWRAGLLAALLYLLLPAYSLAVLWPGVADPLVAFFFLLTIWWWLDYLEIGGARRFALAYFAFIVTLLTKEIGAVLPMVLFLVDRWLVRTPVSIHRLTKRYGLFMIALLAFALLEWRVLTWGVFTRQLGYGVGTHIFDALIHHLATLAFPWHAGSLWSKLWLIILIGFLGYAAYRRAWRILFLGAAMALTMLPILPFPSAIAFAPRYLYLPLMGSMVALGVLIAWLWESTSHRQGRRLGMIGLALALTLLLGWHGATVAEGAVNFAGAVRAERLQFRPLFQRYPMLAPGTLLYFVAPSYPNLSGLMFTRYGARVKTETTDTLRFVGLRDYTSAYVIYRDDENVWRDQPVEPTVNVHATPTLPVTFESTIVLERVELGRQQVKRGDVLIAILYWRAAGKIEKDYTAFMHLVDAQGNRVDGIDAPPRQHYLPMTAWQLGEWMPDGMILPIARDIPPGEYRIEIGLYDVDTMRRLDIVDVAQQRIADKLVLSPIWISE